MKSRVTYFGLVLCMATLVLSLSCQRLRPLEGAERGEARPAYQIWVRYLPNTDLASQGLLGVRPVPMDNGWTDLRMRRDLQRMYFAGISVILVEVSPLQLSGEEFLARFRRFGEYASEYGLSVALFLIPAQGAEVPRLERGNLSGYLRRLELGALPSYFRRGDFPVVLVDEAFGLSDGVGLPGEGVELLRVGRELPSRQWSPAQGEAGEYCWAWGGVWRRQEGKEGAPGEWLLPRRKGEALRRQLQALRESPCQVLLLSSWNDYRDGSFLEPNSLDGEALPQALKRR